MAPRDRSHILVPSPGEAEPFSPSPGRDGPSPPSPADRTGHGGRLKDELEQAFATGLARRPQESDRIEGAIDGIYVESELEAWLRSTMCRRIEFRRADRCLVCPSCGASASLPLGVTCADHQPREVWA